jgi:hypothetical protein
MPTAFLEQFPHLFEIALGTSRGAFVLLWIGKALLGWQLFRKDPPVLKVIVFLALWLGVAVTGYGLLFP